jgi:hypothetical protein
MDGDPAGLSHAGSGAAVRNSRGLRGGGPCVLGYWHCLVAWAELWVCGGSSWDTTNRKDAKLWQAQTNMQAQSFVAAPRPTQAHAQDTLGLTTLTLVAEGAQQQ